MVFAPEASGRTNANGVWIMVPLFPLQFNCVKIVAKAATLGFTLANVGIATLDAHSIEPPPDLVSWWPGDRNAKDIIGDNDGLLKGGASFGKGFVKRAFRFDGIDDFVLVPDSSSLRFGTNDFTVDLWVKFKTTDGEQIIIEKFVETFGPDRQGWSLTKLEGNIIRLAPPGDPVLDVQPTSILPNTWYFVALTRSGDDFTIYWDAEPLGSDSFSVNLDSYAA